MKKQRDELEHTAACLLCGQANIPTAEDAYCCIRGQFFESADFEVPVFVIDPDSHLQVVQLANGQLGLITDRNRRHGPTHHTCMECLHALAESVGADRLDPEE